MSKMKISPTDDCIWFNEGFTLMIDGDAPKEAEIAAGKINNHDRMVEEIAELCKSLSAMTDFVEHQMNPMVNDPSMFDDDDLADLKQAKSLLAKLNQEGEE
ncbi:hypothetical protein NVP1198B_06 [Vibrio phage 1.198.B._10N.286.54.F4]|nr:hypothetical protein NVP1198A_06 [Vibrio phage 1.198.A._10N.286.54.F4]AUR94794.1 hypothetical protein NVP1198B_06 [Vibrio phage 1.198.B._10N.286.54.F4]